MCYNAHWEYPFLTQGNVGWSFQYFQYASTMSCRPAKKIFTCWTRMKSWTWSLLPTKEESSEMTLLSYSRLSSHAVGHGVTAPPWDNEDGEEVFSTLLYFQTLIRAPAPQLP